MTAPRHLLCLFLLFSLIFSWPRRSGAENLPHSPGLIFGRIIFDRRNVFDRGEALDQKFLYRTANKIHIVTKKKTIRHELLFKEGDPYDPFLVAESERILRARPIFRYVTLTPETPQNGKVDILIHTEDSWTTTLQVGFGLAGGKTSYRAGVLEHNFLGWGDSFGFFYRKDIDRATKGIEYQAPNFMGSRLSILGGYGADQTGRDEALSVVRPFYSVLTRYSEGVSVEKSDDQDRLFENGDETGNFQHNKLMTREFFSWAPTPHPSGSAHVTLAHDYTKDEFSDVQLATNTTVPQNRTVSAMLAGVGFKGARYVKDRGVRTFDRDEDINLAWEWSLEAGPSLKALSASRDGALLRADATKACRFDDRLYYFLTGTVESRIEDNRVRNGIFRGENLFNYAHKEEGAATTLRNEIEWGKNLDPEVQFLLGGESGLRGYSVRQLSGSKKVLFILENREVVVQDWLNLINWGWAVFADTGAVWKDDQSPSFKDFKSDIGAGLRFSPSRSTDPGIIRIDLAYALDDNLLRRPWVINIGGELTFEDKTLKKFEQ